MFVYFAFCAYVGVFANIFYYGKPVTGIIFILLVLGAVGIYEWDYDQRKKRNK
jgi:nicotinamide riboside transporter PnuC